MAQEIGAFIFTFLTVLEQCNDFCGKFQVLIILKKL
jgi:hypothetical protein